MGAREFSAPASNTCRLLTREHTAPEPTLALAKAGSLGRGRVRPLAWCSRPRSSTALLAGALALDSVGRKHDADRRAAVRAGIDGHPSAQRTRPLGDLVVARPAPLPGGVVRDHRLDTAA